MWAIWHANKENVPLDLYRYEFSSFQSLYCSLIVLCSVLEIWGPSGPDGERGPHGASWRGRMDGLFRRFLHTLVPYGNAGTPAGDQHFHTLVVLQPQWVSLLWISIHLNIDIFYAFTHAWSTLVSIFSLNHSSQDKKVITEKFFLEWFL